MFGLTRNVSGSREHSRVKGWEGLMKSENKHDDEKEEKFYEAVVREWFVDIWDCRDRGISGLGVAADLCGMSGGEGQWSGRHL